MSYKQNLHVHSTFCDGKDTPTEMIEEAIKRGFDSLGFSIHSFVSCSPIRIDPERIRAYSEEIERLKPIYADRIKIFRGIEHDYYSDSTPNGYDYNLIAVHYLKIDGIYHDCTVRAVKQFQKAKGLKVTGKVDYKTAQKLLKWFVHF